MSFSLFCSVFIPLKEILRQPFLRSGLHCWACDTFINISGFPPNTNQERHWIEGEAEAELEIPRRSAAPGWLIVSLEGKT